MSQPSLFRIYGVAQEYKIIEKVGRGTYGTVYKAKVLKSGQLVAIKKIENKDPKAQAQGFPITALREINLLKTMDHKNIVRLKEIIVSKPQKRNCFRGSTFLVFEYMDHDFAGLFRHKIRYSAAQVKCIMQQVIEGVKYLHDCKILHRDIKSANLLFNNKGEVKIADFGLGRRFRPDYTYTSKVVTLWYRAPELLLGAKQYTEKIDMWSVGCIMAQFLIGEVLFRKDTDFLQIQHIYDICGGLEENNFAESKNFAGYNDFKPEKISNPRRLLETIQKYAPQTDDTTLDLLNKLLQLNPKFRLNSEEALNHPYFHQAPLPCKPSEIKKLDKEYHEMYRDPKPVEKREELPTENGRKTLPKAFENERVPPPPQRKQSNIPRERSIGRELDHEKEVKRRSPDDRGKPKELEYKKERPRNSEIWQKESGREKDQGRARPKENDRERPRSKQRREPQNIKSAEYRERPKDSDRLGPQQKDKFDKDQRQQRHHRESRYSGSRSRSRSRERKKEKNKDQERHRERREPSSRQRSKEKRGYRERSYDNNRGQDKPGSRIYQKQGKEYYKQRQREKDRYPSREKEREGYREHRERDNRERQRSRSRERERERERDRERDRERQREREKQRERERQRERDREREKERDRSRDRDRDRERGDRDRGERRDRQRDRPIPMTREAYQKFDSRASDEGRSKQYPRPVESRREGYWNDRNELRSSREMEDYKRYPLPPPPKQDTRKP